MDEAIEYACDKLGARPLVVGGLVKSIANKKNSGWTREAATNYLAYWYGASSPVAQDDFVAEIWKQV